MSGTSEASCLFVQMYIKGAPNVLNVHAYHLFDGSSTHNYKIPSLRIQNDTQLTPLFHDLTLNNG